MSPASTRCVPITRLVEVPTEAGHLPNSGSSSGRLVSVVALAAFLVEQPDAIAKLLTQHVDDGRGRCRSCAIGSQRGFHTWPCTIHAAAEMAAATRGAAGGRPDRYRLGPRGTP